MAFIQEFLEGMKPGETKNLKREKTKKVFKVGVRGGYMLFHGETANTEPSSKDLAADDWIEVTS